MVFINFMLNGCIILYQVNITIEPFFFYWKFQAFLIFYCCKQCCSDSLNYSLECKARFSGDHQCVCLFLTFNFQLHSIMRVLF